MNPNEWTALRPLYAADWQTNHYAKRGDGNKSSRSNDLQLVEQKTTAKSIPQRTPLSAEAHESTRRKQPERIKMSI